MYWNIFKSGATKAWSVITNIGNEVKEFWDDPVATFEKINEKYSINNGIVVRLEGLVANVVDIVKGVNDTINLVGDTLKYGISKLTGVEPMLGYSKIFK